MKMKMKMKNNKMFLALVVVAALAMVSVAGVSVLSDNQSDADTTYIQASGSITISSSMSGTDLFIYNADLASLGAFDIIIGDAVTYSGTLTVGTISGAGTAASPYVYTAVNSIKVASASDIIVSVAGGTGAMTVSGSYTGEITLLKGTVTVGTTAKAFTGSVVGATATLNVINAYGVTLTYGTTDILSGNIYAGTGSAAASVTVSGTAYMKGTSVGSAVEFVIADGATVTELTAISFTVTGTVGLVNDDVKVYSAKVGSVVLTAHNGPVTSAVALGANEYGIDSAGTTMYYKVVANAGDNILLVVMYDSTGGATYVASKACTYTECVTVSTLGVVSKSQPMTTSLTAINVTSTATVVAGTTVPATIAVSGATGTPFTVSAAISGTTLTMTYTGLANGAIGYVTLPLTYNGALYTDTLIVTGTAANTGTIAYLSTGFTVDTPAAAIISTVGDLTVINGAMTVATTGTELVSFSIGGVDYTDYAEINGTALTYGGILFAKAAANPEFVVVTMDADENVYTMTGTMSISADGTTVVLASKITSSSIVVGAGTNYNISSSTIGIAAATKVTGTLSNVTTTGVVPTLTVTLTSSGTNVNIVTTGANATWTGFLNLTITTSTGSYNYTFFVDVYATNAGTLATSVTTGAAGGVLVATKTIAYNAGTMTIKGTFVVPYDVDTAINYAYLTNNNVIDLTGSMNYGVAYATTENAPAINTTDGVINGAYYSVITGTTAKTYYYTTLDKAMAASNAIFICGTVEVAKDTVLGGTSETANAVTLNADAVVKITSNAILIKPETTTLTITSGGKISVVSGIFEVAKLTSDSYAVTEVSAATFSMDANYGYYADLATALGKAVADEVITLRTDATVEENATVIATVELVDAGHMITINKDITLTVNGKFTSTGVTAVIGTLVINGESTIAGANTIAAGGVITINKDAIVAVSSAFTSAGTEKNPAVFNVNGTLTVSGFVAGSYSTVNIVGKVTTTSQSFIGNVTVIVSGSLTTGAAESIYILNVTDTGKVDGSAGIITITNASIIGTAGSALYVNAASVTGIQVTTSSAYIIVYGTAANVTVGGTNIFTEYFLKSDLYATAYGFTGCSVKVLKVENPVIEGYNFLYWATAPVSGTPITSNTSGATIGSPSFGALYGYTQAITYSVTFSVVQNGAWTINGNSAYGTTIVAYATSYNVQFSADNGYELKDVKILVNGSAMPAKYIPANGDVLTISGSVEEKSVGDSGLTVTEILLIVMIIITAVIAVVVIFKLMRS